MVESCSSVTIDELQRENEILKKELRLLEGLNNRDELKRLQEEVDRLRQRSFCHPDAEKDEKLEHLFKVMQAEILDLRSRCHGYHRAFEEAQKKLNALRILFTQKILPKMQNRDANNPDCLSTPVKSALSVGSSRAPGSLYKASSQRAFNLNSSTSASSGAHSAKYRKPLYPGHAASHQAPAGKKRT